jgi:preprotein translocase subunit YajC
MKKIIYTLVCLQTLIFSAPFLGADEAEALPPPPQQGMAQTMIMIAMALIFFYFIMWRPEQKRRKLIEQQRSSLKKGDKVTAVGIIGTVLRVDEQTVILKMYDGSKIEVLKGAITDVISASEEEARKLEKEEKSGSSKRIEISDLE